MAQSFIGLPMLVTLRDPPGAQLRGVVGSVVPGKSLTLVNGMLSPFKFVHVDGSTLFWESIFGKEDESIWQCKPEGMYFGRKRNIR